MGKLDENKNAGMNLDKYSENCPMTVGKVKQTTAQIPGGIPNWSHHFQIQYQSYSLQENSYLQHPPGIVTTQSSTYYFDLRLLLNMIFKYFICKKFAD